MFSSNTTSNDVSNNGISALLQRIQASRSDNNNSLENSSSQLSQPDDDNLNVSSTSQLQNQIAAPIVSVVSSSMDFFGAPESTNNAITSTFNNHNVGINTSADAVTPSQMTDKTENEDSLAQPSKGLKRKKIEPNSSNKKEVTKVDRAQPHDGNPITNRPKKTKHKSKAIERRDAGVAHTGDTTNTPEMSFEQATVVAVLSNLYGALGKTDSLNHSIDTTRNDSNSSSINPSTTLYKGNPAMIGISGSSVETKKQSNVNIPIMKTVTKRSESPQYFRSQQEFVQNANQKLKKMANSIVEKKSDPSTSKPSVVYHPSQYDVLLGRGKSNKNHPGNVWFQDYIQANRDRYFNAPTNGQKRHITMEILETIRRKGRFLRRGAQGWVDVGTADVQQKIAHALQYRRRCVLREQEASETPESTDPYSSNTHPSPQQPPNASSNQFDANAIALAMVSNSGNFALAQLDAKAREEQYKLNQEYYQKYLQHLQQKSHDSSAKDKNDGDLDRSMNSSNSQISAIRQQQQQQQNHPLYALSHSSQLRRPSIPSSMPNSISSMTSAALSQMPNLLFHRYSNSSSNDRHHGGNIISNTNLPSSQMDNLDSSGTHSAENNLDSSGLHSLADAISQLCSQEGIDNTLSRGYSRG